LNAAAGWTVTTAAPVTIKPGQTVTEHFKVPVPAGAEPGDRTLTVSVTPRAGPPGGRTGQVEASATVTVPYTSFAGACNNTGVSDKSRPPRPN
jgi:hypothetical protein